MYGSSKYYKRNSSLSVIAKRLVVSKSFKQMFDLTNAKKLRTYEWVSV